MKIILKGPKLLNGIFLKLKTSQMTKLISVETARFGNYTLLGLVTSYCGKETVLMAYKLLDEMMVNNSWRQQSKLLGLGVFKNTFKRSIVEACGNSR